MLFVKFAGNACVDFETVCLQANSWREVKEVTCTLAKLSVIAPFLNKGGVYVIVAEFFTNFVVFYPVFSQCFQIHIHSDSKNHTRLRDDDILHVA